MPNIHLSAKIINIRKDEDVKIEIRSYRKEGGQKKISSWGT